METTVSKLIGKRKREYLAGIVRQESRLDPKVTDRLTDTLDGAIRSLRTTKEQRARVRDAAPETLAAAKPASKSFDPYGFNAILVLRRGGREALAAKLAEIAEVGHLRQLADAQLIGLDADMRTGAVDIEDLREAVLRGVERLVADRRAAAS